MSESKIKKVKSIREAKIISEKMSIMDVGFEDNTSAKLISSYSDSLKFIDKEVVVDFREDIFDGRVEKFVAQITMTSIVSTLEREKDIKLFSETTGEIFSTIAFGDIPETGVTGAILFCTNVMFERSERAYWAKLTCLDRDRKSSNIRLFEPTRDKANFINRYIRVDLRKGRIDFNASKAELVEGMPPSANPEIQIAKSFILDVIKDNKEIIEFIDKTSILDYVEKYNTDEDVEPGYEMVRLAMEIEMINNLKNITKDLNLESMMKYSIVSRGYCITNDGNTVKSKPLQNLYVAIQNGIITSKLDMCMLDPESTMNVPEKVILEDLHSVANKLALVNRTYFFDKIK